MNKKKEFSSTDSALTHSSVRHDDQKVSQHTDIPHPSDEYILLDTIIDHHSGKKMASLRLVIPTYLDNQLTQIAAGKRVTKRYLILKALSETGYRIEKEDLVADKRRVR